jgi:D-apionate oxidoisomerase
MTEVAILGAGGNMGRRITRGLRESPGYHLRLLEKSDRGRQLIEEAGGQVVSQKEGFADADVVVFAVPDKISRFVAAEVIPLLDAGTSILFLDPAVIAAGRIEERSDISCFVVHPTHPPLYSLMDEESADARRDYWGGGLARQAIVFAKAWGDDGQLDKVEQLAMAMFAPITDSHRITVEQMAMLEPALSETLANGCVAIIKEGMHRVIDAGVPEAATRAFLMGHLQIGIAIIFEQLDWKLSEGAALALEKSKDQLFKEDWYRIFDHDEIQASLRTITGGE